MQALSRSAASTKKHSHLFSYCHNIAAADLSLLVSHPSAATSTPIKCQCSPAWHTVCTRLKTTIKQHGLTWRFSSCALLIPLQILHRPAVLWEANLHPSKGKGNTSVYFSGLVANTPFYTHTLDAKDLLWLMWNLICSTSPTQRTSSHWESLGKKTQGTSQIWNNK